MDGGEGLANIAIHSFQLTNQIRNEYHFLPGRKLYSFFVALRYTGGGGKRWREMTLADSIGHRDMVALLKRQRDLIPGGVGVPLKPQTKQLYLATLQSSG